MEIGTGPWQTTATVSMSIAASVPLAFEIVQSCCAVGIANSMAYVAPSESRCANENAPSDSRVSVSSPMSDDVILSSARPPSQRPPSEPPIE